MADVRLDYGRDGQRENGGNVGEPRHRPAYRRKKPAVRRPSPAARSSERSRNERPDGRVIRGFSVRGVAAQYARVRSGPGRGGVPGAVPVLEAFHVGGEPASGLGAGDLSPSAAWIGVTGSLSPEPVLLSLAVALWAGSFDILYHTQDYEFHRQSGLHSIAARFGIVNAFRIAG